MSEKEKPWEPTWLYRAGDGDEPEARLFEDGPPEGSGWEDHPEKCAPKKRGPGRPPKSAE